MTNAGVYLGHMDDQIVATSNGGAVVHAFGIKSVAPSFGFDENGDVLGVYDVWQVQPDGKLNVIEQVLPDA